MRIESARPRLRKPLPRWWVHACTLALLALSIPNCGKLGERDGLNRLLDYNPEGVGCLNGIGPRVQAYVNGTVSPADWEATIDCASDNLDMFRRFVRGTGPDGTSYTRNDISAFLANFLLTSYPNNSRLVQAAFELKAALLGGSASLITPAELDTVISLIHVVRVETLKLLPAMQARVASPDEASLSNLSAALTSSIANIAAALPSAGTSPLAWSSVQALAEELGRASGLPPVAPELGSWLSAAAQVLLGQTTDDSLPAGMIPELLRLAGVYAGPLAAAVSYPSDKLSSARDEAYLFYQNLAHQLKAGLDESVARNQGGIPLTAFDRLIDRAPASWIAIDRTVLKNTLRPVTRRLLQAQTADTLDGPAFDHLYSVLDAYVRGQVIIDAIYDGLASDSRGVEPSAFTQAATEWQVANGLPTDAPILDRLNLIASKYVPLFDGDDGRVRFDVTLLSRNGLSTMLWIRMAVEQLLAGYSSEPAKDRASLDEFRQVILDFQDLGFQLHVIDNSIPDAYKSRFLEANLFTQASNGDDYVDADEATYYIASFYSAKQLSSQVLSDMEKLCPSSGVDPLGWAWVDVDCFRREYFANIDQYWNRFPHLIAYYKALSAADQAGFDRALEAGARRYGLTELPIASYDSDGIAGLTYYMEGLFKRFDANGDQILDLNELMKAYPVFKDEIATIAGIDPSNDSELQAIFTYLVKYQEPPSKDLLGITRFLIWEAEKPLWKVNADRMAVFKVMAQVAGPTPGASPTPSPSPDARRPGG